MLFLAAFLAYGVGSTISTSIAGSADRDGIDPLLITGTTLMLVNSAMVIGIGVQMFPILRPHNNAIAVGYLGTRISRASSWPPADVRNRPRGQA